MSYSGVPSPKAGMACATGRHAAYAAVLEAVEAAAPREVAAAARDMAFQMLGPAAHAISCDRADQVPAACDAVWMLENAMEQEGSREAAACSSSMACQR